MLHLLTNLNVQVDTSFRMEIVHSLRDPREFAIENLPS